MGLFKKIAERSHERERYITDLIDRLTADKEEMLSLSNGLEGYIDQEAYSANFERYTALEREAEKALSRSHLFHRTAYRRLGAALADHQNVKNGFALTIQTHNSTVQDRIIGQAYDLIGMVEGRRPDIQQMTAIVKDAHSHLVLAGAGTGKTTTIVGKVKYLLMSGRYRPQDICMISFTNVAVEEMRTRLKKETNSDIYTATFHKLGYDIIKRSDRQAPDVYTESMSSFIADNIKMLSEDKNYEEVIVQYILYHHIPAKTEYLFSDEREYQEYLQTYPPVTVLGENVKSYGELQIANFLAQHGIVYQYEAAYKFSTADEGHRQYHPDFYLPEHDIYIEYFGIDRKGAPPKFFAPGYIEGMEWKRELHKANDTKLIECFAYEHFEGILLDELRIKLEKYQVPLQELSLDDIIAKTNDTKNSYFSAMAEVIAKIISLSKNRRISSDDIYEMCRTRAPGQLPVIQLVQPIMKAYEEHLRKNGMIDFTDMVNRAIELVRSGQFEHKFKCVIIDEYQDITAAQYTLMRALRDQHGYELFCVGDDWQSIYRFAGSDIGYILNFGNYWGDCEISRIETTYRYSQRLVDISGEFIMKDPYQYRKYMRSGDDRERYVIGNIHGYNESCAYKFMIDKMEQLPQGASVFLLGRYGFDINKIKDDSRISVRYDNRSGVQRVYLDTRRDLEISFYTAHRSKGAQADYVFIVNNRRDHMGFPSKVPDPPIVKMLLENADDYPYAEERRLFYVALTRAKRRVYLVTVENDISTFAKELIEKYGEEMKKEAWSCPLCGGDLRKRTGRYGEFYGCSNYKSAGCRYTRKIVGKDSDA